MPEIMTFSSTVTPATTVYRIARLEFDWYNAHVTIVLRQWTGIAFGANELPPIHYTGAVATTMMIGLNKVNLATQSLHSRVMDRLITDGKIPVGTASGSAD